MPIEIPIINGLFLNSRYIQTQNNFFKMLTNINQMTNKRLINNKYPKFKLSDYGEVNIYIYILCYLFLHFHSLLFHPKLKIFIIN